MSKPLFKSKIPAGLYVSGVIVIIMSILLLIKGMSILGTLFYAISISLLLLYMMKDNFILWTFNDRIEILFFNPIKGKMKLPYENITEISTERDLKGSGDSNRDSVFVSYKIKRKENFFELLVSKREELNPLYEIIEEKTKLKTTHVETKRKSRFL